MCFDNTDCGMAYLSLGDNHPLVVVLAENEKLILKGDDFKNVNSINIVSGFQNRCFAQYATEHPRREQALSVWEYLESLYATDSIFSMQEKTRQAIAAEKNRIRTDDIHFLKDLPVESYIAWYLPIRKLSSSVSTVAQYRTQEIPSTIAAFRNINHADHRLQKSGLLAEIIESHFWLIENSGLSLDSVYGEMKVSIDCLIRQLLDDEKKLNATTTYLFHLLEKRSLFEASEYLALKLLNVQGCSLDDDFAKQLEAYRSMKKGHTAPDFDFTGTVAPGYETTARPRKLSDLENEYTVVFFGASWCPQCPQELLKVSKLYEKWKKHDIEVVFVSLDEEERVFKNFSSIFPFISICDYKKWDSPIVEKYHVFATPTLYLLDRNRGIVLRPNSVDQLDAWVDRCLIQGNSNTNH